MTWAISTAVRTRSSAYHPTIVSATDPTRRAFGLATMIDIRASEIRKAQTRARHWLSPAPAARQLYDLAKLLRWEARCAGWSAPRGRVVRWVADQVRAVEPWPHIPARHRQALIAIADQLLELANECSIAAPRACMII